MKTLFKTVALISVFSFLTRVAGFVFRIILSRVVGAEGMGLYQVASSVFMVLLTVISSGIPLIISRMTAGYNARKEQGKEGKLVAVALVYVLILSIVLCAIVLLFRSLFSNLFTDERCIQILIILLPSLVFSSVYCVLRGALWGRNNYFALCVSEFYEQLVHIVVGILLINASLTAIDNAKNLAWSMTIACLLSMIFVVLLYFYYGGKIGKLKKGYLKPLIKDSTPITFMKVAGSFIQPIIALIIPAQLIKIGYTSSQALSLYGIASGMTLPLLFIPTTIIGSLSTALIPDISTAIAQNDKNHIAKRITTSINFSLVMAAMFVPVFLGIGEFLGIFLYDNVLSGTLLQSAAWALIPLGFTNISSALLNSLGLENKSFIHFVIGAVVMFISLWFLPSIMGINALIWAMGLNYLTIAILNIALLKRKTKVELKLLPQLLKILLIMIPSSALTAFIVNLCNFAFPLFITIVIGGATALISFIALAGVFNLIDIKAYMFKIKSQFKFKKLKPKHAK